MRSTPTTAFSVLSVLVVSALATTDSHAMMGVISVPDGGSMALLLGVALLGLAGFRKLISKK